MVLDFSGLSSEDDGLLGGDGDEDGGSACSETTIMASTEASERWLRVKVVATSIAVACCGASLIAFVVFSVDDEVSAAIDLCVVSGSMLLVDSFFSVVGALLSLVWALTLSSWLLLPSLVCQATTAIFLAQFLANGAYSPLLAVLALISTMLIDTARHRAALALRRYFVLEDGERQSIYVRRSKDDFERPLYYQGGDEDESLISL